MSAQERGEIIPFERSALDHLLGLGVDPESLVDCEDYLTDAPWGDGEVDDRWIEDTDYSDEFYHEVCTQITEAFAERQLREAEAIARWPRQPKQRSYSAKKGVCQKLRWRVFKRDQYRCVRCAAEEDLTVDHIVPEVHGGPDHIDNLQTLCRPCNSTKGAR